MSIKDERLMVIMACGVLSLGFGYLFLVTFWNIPVTGQDHAKTIVGFMCGSVVSLIIGYFWGSSSGSTAKSKTIEKMVESQEDDKKKGR